MYDYIKIYAYSTYYKYISNITQIAVFLLHFVYMDILYPWITGQNKTQLLR